MGSMEKKRLLPAVTGIALAALALVSSAEDPPRLEGIRTEAGEKDIVSVKKFLKTLGEPDMKKAEEVLSETKKNPHARERKEEAEEFFSAKPDSRSPAEADVSPAAGGAGLFYFFSFSMPPATLRAVAEETAAAGGVMVLRGLAGGDLRETVSLVSGVVGKTGAEIWIEPSLFECLGVEAVPQPAVVSGFSEGADCGGADYVKVSGDVSVSRALEIMEKEDENAGTFLGRMRKGGFYGD